MNNWIIGACAITLWLGATVLYMRRSIVMWFVERRKARKALAAAQANYQAEQQAQSQEILPPG